MGAPGYRHLSRRTRPRAIFADIARRMASPTRPAREIVGIVRRIALPTPARGIRRHGSPHGVVDEASARNCRGTVGCVADAPLVRGLFPLLRHL
jgi:hypothetical protein